MESVSDFMEMNVEHGYYEISTAYTFGCEPNTYCMMAFRIKRKLLSIKAVPTHQTISETSEMYRYTYILIQTIKLQFKKNPLKQPKH